MFWTATKIWDSHSFSIFKVFVSHNTSQCFCIETHTNYFLFFHAIKFAVFWWNIWNDFKTELTHKLIFKYHEKIYYSCYRNLFSSLEWNECLYYWQKFDRMQQFKQRSLPFPNRSGAKKMNVAVLSKNNALINDRKKKS